VLPIYGGQPIGRQLDSLRAGVDVVVATPGRAFDHLDGAA
jgi:ATP-dependent RNA helicase DeaD